MIILNQLIKLDQIFRMKSERMKYQTILCIATIAVAVLVTSFVSVHHPETNLIPDYNSVNGYEHDKYDPEFNLKTDSVTIPMKRSGGCF